jgi:uncharacterized membrane protein YccC
MKSAQIKPWLQREWRDLLAVKSSDRPWQMPVAAAMSAGLPLMVGVWWDRLDQGLIASLGGLAFLYLPETTFRHRMLQMLACGAALTGCFALGSISHLTGALLVLILTLATILITIISRYFALGPPGSLFFIMVASIGAYIPAGISPWYVQATAMGSGALLAWVIALIYSVFLLRHRQPKPKPQRQSNTLDFLILEPCIIGFAVGVSLAVAELAQLQKPYWVPVACLAVVQGATMRAVWNRQLHRMVGTTLGLLLAWAILALPLDKWSIVILVMTLMFLVETLVVRHYALAAFFITPMAILLTEARMMDHSLAGAVIVERFYDTILGTTVGLVGGACLHHPRIREALRKWLQPLYRLANKMTAGNSPPQTDRP